MRLSELSQGADAVVHEVENVMDGDPIARRLRDYGFVRGEPVRLVGRGPIGADPLLIQGPGGNTSFKSGDELWVKASGAWLAEASAAC